MIRISVPQHDARPPRVALFVNRLTQGGVQHSFVGLAEAIIERGCDVDLVVGDRGGFFEHATPPGLRTIFLHQGAARDYLINDLRARLGGWVHRDRQFVRQLTLRYRSYLPGLSRYLKSQRPDAMLSAKTLGNLVAILARKRSRAATRVVVSERSHVSESIARSRRPWKTTVLPRLMQELYPLADEIVSISRHVGDDLARVIGLQRNRITTIYNALLRPSGLDAPAADHPWFRDDMPVILGAGRLSKQKDFPTLIHAFALVRKRRPARLMIIGEGEDQALLEKLAASHGISDDVLLLGFQANPFAFMKAADLFVLSSTHEGFGNVLLEALASGCAIVSTDCPAGPSEILDDGRFGRLVPVGETDAMAEAIEATLDRPPLSQPLLARAEAFSMDRTAGQYLACLLPDYLRPLDSR